jgi:acyl-coenzyme A thioesterase PaaI-like protein
VTSADAQAILSANFAPWVQDLALRVESVDAEGAMLRLPFDAKLIRVGGIVCGQALMSAADTTMVIAVSAKLAGF